MNCRGIHQLSITVQELLIPIPGLLAGLLIASRSGVVMQEVVPVGRLEVLLLLLAPQQHLLL
jgi:hypothetical protein